MKVIVFILLLAAICELLLSVTEWIREAKEIIVECECEVFNEYIKDLEEILGSNTAYMEV